MIESQFLNKGQLYGNYRTYPGIELVFAVRALAKFCFGLLFSHMYNYSNYFIGFFFTNTHVDFHNLKMLNFMTIKMIK